jgi:hypothetical protein
LHGWNQGTWPAGGPHYFFSNAVYNGADYNVYSWSDPFGANNFSTVGMVDLVDTTGVSVGMPVDTPQLGGQTLQANDFRPQDFEYRDGYGWSVQTIACNPGGGTVNCVRWAQIDPATATVVDAGVFGSSGEYRTFGDLAVDACGNMAVGYTKSSTSIYPGIWVTGRLSTNPAGTLQAETQLKAGEIAYTSFESSAPRRWGDYTEMTVSPDGTTFWYLGEYSKDTGTTNGRWGTYIGAFSYACNPGGGGDLPPTVNISSPTDGASFNSGESISFAGSASDVEDGDLTAGLAWTSDLDGQIGTGGAFNAVLSDGTHTITAEVTDSGGNTASDSITITVGGSVDNPPNATIVNPLDGSTVSNSVTIEVDATDVEDPTGSLTVDVAIDGGVWQAAAFNSSSGYYEFAWDTTAVANGSHTIDARATDSSANTTNASPVSVNVDNGGTNDPTKVSIGDLDGNSINNGSTWTAQVTILVVDNTGAVVAGAVVDGSWSNGASGSASCTTNSSGLCTVSVGGIRKNAGSVNFTVDNVTASGLTYDATANTDPDGDSDGTTITVLKP